MANDSVGDMVGDTVGELIGGLVNHSVGDMVGDSVGELIGGLANNSVGDMVGKKSCSPILRNIKLSTTREENILKLFHIPLYYAKMGNLTVFKSSSL